MPRVLIVLMIPIMMSAGFYKSYHKHPIYHSIRIHNPSLEKEVAFNYSQIIAKYARRYRLDPFLIVSIARQESGIVVNKERGFFHDKVVYLGDNTYVRYFEITDFCMMQIHRNNVRSLRLDPNRLLSDPDYCVQEGAKILDHFRFLEAIDPVMWWTRYNSSLADKRTDYYNDIMKHYRKIKNNIENFEQIVEMYTGKEYVDISVLHHEVTDARTN